MKRLLIMMLILNSLVLAQKWDTLDRREGYEFAFMEGQRAYAEGQICIKRNEKGVYEWIVSPWETSGDYIVPRYKITHDDSFRELHYNLPIPKLIDRNVNKPNIRSTKVLPRADLSDVDTSSVDTSKVWN